MIDQIGDAWCVVSTLDTQQSPPLVAHASGHGIYLILRFCDQTCLVHDHRSQITKYPIPFVSHSLDWLAWLGLASLASAWLVSSAAATTTATTPEQASTTIAAARSAAPIVIYACSGVVAVVVAAADETSHAEARLAKPSQASQSREGLTNGFGYACD